MIVVVGFDVRNAYKVKYHCVHMCQLRGRRYIKERAIDRELIRSGVDRKDVRRDGACVGGGDPAFTRSYVRCADGEAILTRMY